MALGRGERRRGGWSWLVLSVPSGSNLASPAPGLWTVNRSGHGVGIQACVRGVGDRTLSVLPRKGDLLVCPRNTHMPAPQATLQGLGGGQARGPGTNGCFPSAPPPSTSCHRISQNRWCLQISLTRIRGAVSLLLPNPASERRPQLPAGSATRHPSSGLTRFMLPSRAKPLKNRKLSGRRGELRRRQPLLAGGAQRRLN